MGHLLLTSPSIADMYTFLMNTQNALPQSYQHRVCKTTHVTVKRQNQQAENPTPAMLSRVEAAPVDNAILRDYLTCDVALQEPEIGSADPDIPIDKNCTDDKLHSGMPEGSENFENEGDGSDDDDAILTPTQ
jgi:hypothetical protein